MSQHSLYPFAVHVFSTRGAEVLLLRRANTGYEDGKYSVVAGHVEHGETALNAAIREAREEVGVEIANGDLKVVGTMHRRSEAERVDLFVRCERWLGKVENCEPTKCDGLRWARSEELPPNTIPYVAAAITMTEPEPWFVQFGWD